ncbi:MAG: cyclic nucleotide-binding domain-containing protein [Pseudomonadota bacterium]|nr:cyclic nucleotide-binding domain-containing protein [Pseudomonadota bacterium]
MPIADELASVPSLRLAPRAELRGTAPLWSVKTLSPGAALWTEGEAVEVFAVLVSGELVVEHQGTPVGRVQHGDVLGESSAFLGGLTRTATLRARTEARVLTLPVSSLSLLRSTAPAVYDALVELGLHALCRRLATVDRDIAKVAAGGAVAPVRVEASKLVRLWKALRPGLPQGACPSIAPLLRRQPGLEDIDGTALAAIATGFVAEPVPEGTVLFLEGELRSSAWLVASGTVDVLRNVRGGRAELLVTLGAGAILGVNALVEQGPRTASCVTTSPCWLYRADAKTTAHLEGQPRLAWREAVLGILACQVRRADDALQAIRSAKTVPVRGAIHGASVAPASVDGELEAILRASGWLEAIPRAELDEVEVVFTEDDSRNRGRARHAAA